MIRKAEKRKKKQQDRGIVNFMMVQQHFWKDLRNWINEMSDPRNESYITYTQADLVFMGILKNICGQESMREMDENFNEEICISTLSRMSGNRKLEEMPHYDTLNYYLERLSPGCLADLRKKMVASLIRGRQFYRNRLSRKYWRVVLDGTQLYYFKERHCEN
ncbi:MAG: transposase family protein [Lachnospiraceae bacterium]|nr:transposase family protein [Lachnospiraceae bacterium]